MARTRKKPFDREKDKTRNFELLIYPDALNYNCAAVLEAVPTYFTEWAYCLHDADYHEDSGELKKAHYHVIGCKTSPNLLSTIANGIGVPVNCVNPVYDLKKAIRYLAHLDDADKTLYPVSAIKSNLNLNKYIKETRDDEADAEMIFDYICDSGIVTKKQLLRWVFANGYWASYRRAASTWSDLLYENRLKIYSQYKVDDTVDLNVVAAVDRIIFSETDEVTPFEQMKL